MRFMDTTFFIDRSNDAVMEEQIHHFVAEASELRLPPGEWPEFIGTNMGNGQLFKRTRMTENVVRYEQMLGCIVLDIFND